MKKNKSSSPIILLLPALALVLSVNSGAQAAAGKKFHVAVLNFRPVNIEQSVAEITGNYLEMELLRSKKLIMLEREQIKESYHLKELNQYACQDDSCAVFAGKQLEADYVVYGDIEKKDRIRVTARVVSVKSEKTILTCMETFPSMGRSRRPIKRIADKIIAAILNQQKPRHKNHKKRARKKKSAQADLKISPHLRPLVFQPLGKLGSLLNTGAGFTCGLMFSNMAPGKARPVQNITVGIDFGFLYAPGLSNDEDSFMMAPFLVTFGYRVLLFEKIYLTPLVSGGFSYFVFNHATGSGFDMEDNSIRESLDGLFRFTALFGRPVAKNLHLQAMLSFWLLAEATRPPYFLTVNLGLQYCFSR